MRSLSHKSKLKLEIAITSGALIFLFVASFFGFKDAFHLFDLKISEGMSFVVFKQISFIFLVGAMLYGGAIYQICRLAYLIRKIKHKPLEDKDTNWLFEKQAPTINVLIPSYKEEDSVMWQTLFSACIQDYPNKRVTLLIDNPPHSSDPVDKLELAQARKLVDKMNYLFAQLHSDIMTARNAAYDAVELSNLFTHCARWCQVRANEYSFGNHSDRFFTEKVLVSTVNEFKQKAALLRDGNFGKSDLILEYKKLLGRFKISVNSFERKMYINLSHQPNKAMNLNSYISLIGKKFKVEHTPEGEQFLKQVEDPQDYKQVLEVEKADYCLTLDADSILLPGYIKKLVYMMELPENLDIAVIQTPYSAFPRSPGDLEKIAGATTDIQFIIHQGFTFFNSTFWVGANAILRFEALQDIAEEVDERGYKVTRYIHDHTVIEDTESTIDLALKGWRLLNYPERLAYSATPPDFGSLLIQRKRWANGGLLIFPKLLKRIFSFRLFLENPVLHIMEALVRSHYLLSIAIVNIGLLILLGVSFEECTNSMWLPLTAIPYYFLYARDLSLNGYKFLDIIKVYALNLVLIPINLGGVFESIYQGVTGKHTAFARTPKVIGRTAAPWEYIAYELGLVIGWFALSLWGFFQGHVVSPMFGLSHSIILGFGLIHFIGRDAMKEDLVMGFQYRFGNKTEEALVETVGGLTLVTSNEDDSDDIKAA